MAEKTKCPFSGEWIKFDRYDKSTYPPDMVEVLMFLDFDKLGLAIGRWREAREEIFIEGIGDFGIVTTLYDEGINSVIAWAYLPEFPNL